MATGDQNDVWGRLRALLPSNWFPQGALAVLDSVLQAPASALSWLYGLIAYARLQTRIATATGGFLDIARFDFLGNTLPRLPNETDPAYSLRIRANLLAPEVTRSALIERLTELTGNVPKVFEPQRPADCGGLGTGYFALGQAGCLGSPVYPYQCFITVKRPKGYGVPYVMGLWGTGNNTVATGGLGQGAFALVPNDAAASIITDADIYALIASITQEGTICWTQLTN